MLGELFEIASGFFFLAIIPAVFAFIGAFAYFFKEKRYSIIGSILISILIAIAAFVAGCLVIIIFVFKSRQQFAIYQTPPSLHSDLPRIYGDCCQVMLNFRYNFFYCWFQPPLKKIIGIFIGFELSIRIMTIKRINPNNSKQTTLYFIPNGIFFLFFNNSIFHNLVLF